MSTLTLSALVIRATPTETALEARDRLWRSVETHDHTPEITAGSVRCSTCSAVLLSVLS